MLLLGGRYRLQAEVGLVARSPDHRRCCSGHRGIHPQYRSQIRRCLSDPSDDGDLVTRDDDLVAFVLADPCQDFHQIANRMELCPCLSWAPRAQVSQGPSISRLGPMSTPWMARAWTLPEGQVFVNHSFASLTASSIFSLTQLRGEAIRLVQCRFVARDGDRDPDSGRFVVAQIQDTTTFHRDRHAVAENTPGCNVCVSVQRTPLLFPATDLDESPSGHWLRLQVLPIVHFLLSDRCPSSSTPCLLPYLIANSRRSADHSLPAPTSGGCL